MSYLDPEVGFNQFLDRSIAAVPAATTLQTLPNIAQNSFNLDEIQVSGALGNVMQLGGAIQGGSLMNSTTEGGRIKNLDMDGDLSLGGTIHVGGTNVTIDGPNKRIIINDGINDRVVIGYDPGGF